MCIINKLEAVQKLINSDIRKEVTEETLQELIVLFNDSNYFISPGYIKKVNYDEAVSLLKSITTIGLLETKVSLQCEMCSESTYYPENSNAKYCVECGSAYQGIDEICSEDVMSHAEYIFKKKFSLHF